MEKKAYTTPETELIYLNASTHLLDWSADKVIGGGTNIPEAKPVVFLAEEDEKDETTTLPIPHYSVWDD